MSNERERIEGTIKLEEILKKGPDAKISPYAEIDPGLAESMIGCDPLYNKVRALAGEKGIKLDPEKPCIRSYKEDSAEITWNDGRHIITIDLERGVLDKVGEVLATLYVKRIEVNSHLRSHLRQILIAKAGISPEVEISGEEYTLDTIRESRETELLEGMTPFALMQRTCPEINDRNTELLEKLDEYSKTRGLCIQRSEWWPGNVHKWEEIGVPKHDSSDLPAELQMYPGSGLFRLLNGFYDRMKKTVNGTDLTKLQALSLDFDPDSIEKKAVVYVDPHDNKIRLALVKENRGPSVDQTLFIPGSGYTGCDTQVVRGIFEEIDHYEGFSGVLRDIAEAFGANRPPRRKYKPGNEFFYI